MKRRYLNVNMVEVIDYTKEVDDGEGRAYVFGGAEGKTRVFTDLQDDGRTLKVFISPKLNKKTL